MSSCGRDTGYAEKDIAPTHGVCVLLDPLGDSAFDGIELSFDLCKTLGRLSLQERDGSGFSRGSSSPRRAPRPVLDEGRARDLEFTQGIEILICDWMGRQVEGHTHPSEHGRIMRISPGTLAVAFGEAPCAQGIDLYQGQ